jgi:predicted nucleic acid-binding Zn ribbon protein
VERLGALLPAAARRLGLDEELDLARAMAAWDELVAERAPEVAGASRLVSLDRGVALVEADAPIVAQEIRLRSVELLDGLRTTLERRHGRPGHGIRELRVAIRHV